MKTSSLLTSCTLSASLLFAGCATKPYDPQSCVGWTESFVGIPIVLEVFKSRDSYFTDKNCSFGQNLGILPFVDMTDKGLLNPTHFALWHRQYTKILEDKKALELTGLASNRDKINELQRIITTADYWTKQMSAGETPITSAQLLTMFANHTVNPKDVVLNKESVPPRWQYAPEQPRTLCTGKGVKRICTAPAPANTNTPATATPAP